MFLGILLGKLEIALRQAHGQLDGLHDSSSCHTASLADMYGSRKEIGAKLPLRVGCVVPLSGYRLTSLLVRAFERSRWTVAVPSTGQGRLARRPQAGGER